VARISCVNRNFCESTVISIVEASKRLDGIRSALTRFYAEANSLEENRRSTLPAIPLFK
jgi:hypothetical protein